MCVCNNYVEEDREFLPVCRDEDEAAIAIAIAGAAEQRE